MPRVKGLAFRTVLAVVESLEGPAIAAEVRERLPPVASAQLLGLTANGWYPLEAYAELLATVQAVTGNRRDLPRTIGFRAIEMDLTLIHRLAFAALSVDTVVSIALRLFNTYYDTGRAHCETVSARRIRVTFSGCVGFTEPMWSEVRGSVECLAAKASKASSNSVILSGGGDGPDCVMEVYWLGSPEASG